MNKTSWTLAGIIGGLLIGLAALVFRPAATNIAEAPTGYGRESLSVQPILTAVGSTTTGNIMDVSQFRFITCSVDTDNSATMTIKFWGSLANSAPTASTTASSTNQYAFLSMTDVETNTSTNGNTGVVFNSSNSTGHKMFKVNVDGLNWFSAAVTTWVAGTSTVACQPFSG